MSEPSPRLIQMPPTGKFPQGHQLPLRDRVLVVIGANGSGKTRFGSWLDFQNIGLHHRVSAHRSLVFPERVQPMDFKEAELQLFIGHTDNSNPAHYRQHSRWQSNPDTALLDDFKPLVTLMVSESFTKSDEYRVAMKAENKYVSPPQTRLDLVKQIWEAILPARELMITGNRIETRNRENKKAYHAKEMSDGERGIFHLIGEALSAPKDGVFIVDEPELHLHRAIQARLWDAVESARPDCTFVYITHDLGFASSRKDATKVWLREYSDGKWDWEVVPDSDAFPESLLLEVMGSRHPVLFVEGLDRSSLDHFIYGKVFPEHTVVPCGSCEVVIHSARSFAEMRSLHDKKCGGLIDNDGRTDSDIKMLNNLGIGVLPVALVENLFLLEPILLIACERLGHDSNDVVPRVKDRVFAILKRNAIRVASNLTRQEMESVLRKIGKSGDGVEALTSTFAEAIAVADPAVIYPKWEAEIDRVLGEKDYTAALRLYKIKGLSSEADSVLGTNLRNQVMRWLRCKDEESAPLVTALRSAIGQIPERTTFAALGS